MIAFLLYDFKIGGAEVWLKNYLNELCGKSAKNKNLIFCNSFDAKFLVGLNLEKVEIIDRKSWEGYSFKKKIAVLRKIHFFHDCIGYPLFKLFPLVAVFMAYRGNFLFHCHSTFNHLSENIGCIRKSIFFLLNYIYLCRARCFVACSQNVLDKWNQYIPRFTNSFVHYCGVKLPSSYKKYEPRKYLKNRKYVFLGRLAFEKNLDFLLDVFSIVQSFDTTSTLTFIGEGPCRESLEKKVNLIGLSGNVEFAGEVIDVDLSLIEFDCLILTSKYEGLPLSVVQAQRLGLSCFIPSHVDSSVIVRRELVHRLDGFNALDWAIYINSNFSYRTIVSDGTDNFSIDYNLAVFESVYYADI